MVDDLKNLGIYVSQVISLALKPPHSGSESGQINIERTSGVRPLLKLMK